MVLLAKHKLNKRTLSIGDGANDVPMIQSASIGIGIYGNEGMNAVQASDFAIPEFRGIWRLLFVHGRWNYNRIAEMIKYFFYKNIVFTLCQLWFAYFCSFSGTSIYDAFYLVLYNTIFTGGPVIVRALFEQDVNYMKVIEEAEEDEVIASSRQPLIKD
jgi:phospholipid-transporting ATPase